MYVHLVHSDFTLVLIKHNINYIGYIFFSLCNVHCIGDQIQSWHEHKGTMKVLYSYISMEHGHNGMTLMFCQIFNQKNMWPHVYLFISLKLYITNSIYYDYVMCHNSDTTLAQCSKR